MKISTKNFKITNLILTFIVSLFTVGGIVAQPVWGKPSPDCDQYGNRSISVTVTNGDAYPRSYEIRAYKGAVEIHRNHGESIERQTTRELTLGGIPQGYLKIELLQDGIPISFKNFNFKTCAPLLTPKDPVWGKPSLLCDEYGKRSISVTVTNTTGVPRSYEIRAYKNNVLIHKNNREVVEDNTVRILTLGGVPEGNIKVELRRTYAVLSSEIFNFKTCATLLTPKDPVWGTPSVNCDEYGKRSISVTVTNTSGVPRSYQIKAYKDNRPIHENNREVVDDNTSRRLTLGGVPEGNIKIELRRTYAVLDSEVFYFNNCAPILPHRGPVWGEPSVDCDEYGKRSISIVVTNTTGKLHTYKIKLYNESGQEVHATYDVEIPHNTEEKITLGGIPAGRYDVRLERDDIKLQSRIYTFSGCSTQSCCGTNTNTAAYWRCKTYEEAGIYDWDLSKDLEFNKHTAVNVYTYYGKLYEQSEGKFYWAALGRIVGKDFFGAFRDLHIVRRDIENDRLNINDIHKIFETILKGANLPATVQVTINKLLDFLLEENPQNIAKELRFIEDKLLSMQKEIFDDIAWQHRAYIEGGISLVDNILANDSEIQRELTNEQIKRLRDAWQDFNNNRLVEGVIKMAHHEQRIIIQDDWTEIWDRSKLNKVIVTIMSLVSPSPVENGKSFFDEKINGEFNFFESSFPYIATWDIDLTANLANEKDRWEWTVNDMIPKLDNNLRNRTPLTMECLSQSASILDVDKSRIHQHISLNLPY